MSSSPSIPCVAEKCELASLALCQCCKKDLCIDHLNEHANQRNEKLLPFIDKINVLLNRFSNFYDGDQSIRKQLDEWKQEAHKIIENFYEKKRRDFIDETTDQQRERLNEIHNKLKELIRKKGGTQQDFDTFSENMRLIEEYLDKLQQTQIILPPLTIDDNCILRPLSQSNESVKKLSDNPDKSPEHLDNSSEKSIDKKKSPEHLNNSSEKSTDKKKSSEKSSKKKKKSSRYSDDSSDRSSRHRSRSPRHRTERSKKKRQKSSESNSPSPSSNNKKPHCDDCRDCRFYQDRFGPGFMDSFGPCSCECHQWAYS